MSIHVTVNGNPINIHRGKMVLSDLDQIRRNERDRRRRLRLEQVRQQSKEISNRLLERAKNVARQELSRLEKGKKSDLKQMHDRRIMELQQKYQEDMEDIGEAHASAAVQCDESTKYKEQSERNKLAAEKRGKEAVQQLKEAQKKDDPRVTHQRRLRDVRELEDLRSSMIAKLPKSTTSRKDVNGDSSKNTEDERVGVEKLSRKIKLKRLDIRKSPKRISEKNTKVS